MAGNVTAKDLKKGFGFVKQGGGKRTVFVIVSSHRDGTISYGHDRGVKSFEHPVRISTEEFLKDVFGRKATTIAERNARQRIEAAVTAERIERTKESQSKAVLMDLLMDAKAGKDIDSLTEKLEELIKTEREEAHEAGYDDGYESHREEYSHSRW